MARTAGAMPISFAGKPEDQVTAHETDSPLLKAAEANDLEKVKRHLKEGVDSRGAYGHTALILAAKKGLEVCKKLLSEGADIGLRDKCGYGQLHSAAVMGNLKGARLLVSAGCDVNECANGGFSPLHLALAWNQGEFAEWLIKEAGADCTQKLESSGFTPLQVAIIRRKTYAGVENRSKVYQGVKLEPLLEARAPGTGMPPTREEVFNKWLPYWKDRSNPHKLKIICFHNAASSASIFHGKTADGKPNPWQILENRGEVQILALQFPGREGRAKEDKFTSMPTAAAAAADVLQMALCTYPNNTVPYVLVGTSCGSWVLHETLKVLLSRRIRAPEHVFVSSFAAPTLPPARWPWAKVTTPPEEYVGLESTRGLREIIDCWGMGGAVTKMIDTFGPLILADNAIFNTYEYEVDRGKPDKIADVPIHATVANQDDVIKAEHVKEWEALAGGKFTFYEMDAGHMLMSEPTQRAEYQQMVVNLLKEQGLL